MNQKEKQEVWAAITEIERQLRQLQFALVSAGVGRDDPQTLPASPLAARRAMYRLAVFTLDELAVARGVPRSTAGKLVRVAEAEGLVAVARPGTSSAATVYRCDRDPDAHIADQTRSA